MDSLEHPASAFDPPAVTPAFHTVSAEGRGPYARSACILIMIATGC
jgi:hypothetical protein